MTRARPFTTPTSLLERADAVWWSLAAADWLEAFRSHPKIGEQHVAQPVSTQARAWSEAEQSGTRIATSETTSMLATGNREYEEKFGHIFIVCATGKSVEEMLAMLHERLENNPQEELRIAAEEQRKITQLRLGKLLQSFSKPN